MCAYMRMPEVNGSNSSLQSCFHCILKAGISQSNLALADMASLASQIALRILVFIFWLELPCLPGIYMGFCESELCSLCLCGWTIFLLVFHSLHLTSKFNVCDSKICCLPTSSCHIFWQQHGAGATISPGSPHVPSQFLQVHLAPLCLCLHRKSRVVVK